MGEHRDRWADDYDIDLGEAPIWNIIMDSPRIGEAKKPGPQRNGGCKKRTHQTDTNPRGHSGSGHNEGCKDDQDDLKIVMWNANCWNSAEEWMDDKDDELDADVVMIAEHKVCDQHKRSHIVQNE